MSIKALLVLFTAVVHGEIYLSKSVSFILEFFDINTNPRVFRSSHRECSFKKIVLKISQYLQENTCVESLFNKVADLN